jgi:transposase
VFVRKKINPSGLISVQIIDKSTGSYKVVKTVGSTKDAEELIELEEEGKNWIAQKAGILQFDFDQSDEKVSLFFNAVESLKLAGIDLLLGKIFDDIGFNSIKDSIFKQLVLYRLVYPSSKLKTTEYLSRFQQIYWDENRVYRYLDKLYNTQKQIVQKISYEHTVKVLNGEPQIVFYDVTTIYFEIEKDDDLRQTGFSKDGKHQNPQIVLGLLVSKDGYPLTYEIFKGSQFEGKTMLPIIKSFQEKYHLKKPIIVADAGLLSKENILHLTSENYEFILGGRIKNESQKLKKEITSCQFKNGETKFFDKQDQTRLIVAYSDHRAKKDSFNRERGLKRLEIQIRKGRLTKSHINNKGYNKYLCMEGDVSIKIDYEKYKADSRWDGLKGYITNSKLTSDEIIENYKHLWQIEKAFRVAKTDLQIRPIYHRLPKRIEAHICLNFVAYKVYKELDRLLKIKKAKMSPEKAIEIASFIFTITVCLPESKNKVTRVFLKTEEQKHLAKLFGF